MLVMLNPASAQKESTQNGFRVTAPRQIIRSNGVRLEGNAIEPARIQSSQIDVSAHIIEYFGKQITQIRAQRDVKFKLNLPGPQGILVDIGAAEANFDLVVREGYRTLVLKGGVNGFYETDGVRTVLRGQSATIRFDAKTARNLIADIEGVHLEIPVPTPAPDKAVDKVTPAKNGKDASPDPLDLGNLIVDARRSSIVQKGRDATIRFTGNARIFSNGGADKVDMRAPEIVAILTTIEQARPNQKPAMRRVLQSIETVGRAQFVFDPKPSPPKPPDTAAKEKSQDKKRQDVGRLDSMQVATDKASVNWMGKRQFVFEGNVQGLYRMSAEAPVDAAASTKPADAEPIDYKFSGDRAVATFVEAKDATEDKPEGWNLDVTGRPVSTDVPGLDLGFGDDADDKKKNDNGRN